LVPLVGTFYSVSRPYDPPLPFDEYPNLPAYLLPNGIWVVDDSSIPVPPPLPPDVPAAARDFVAQNQSLAQERLLGRMFSMEAGDSEDDPYAPQLLEPGSAPTNGTFWLLVETNWPALPYNPCTSCDIYSLSDGSFLVDDTGLLWPTNVD